MESKPEKAKIHQAIHEAVIPLLESHQLKPGRKIKKAIRKTGNEIYQLLKDEYKKTLSMAKTREKVFPKGKKIKSKNKRKTEIIESN
jgi:hypothetical protein